MDFERESFIFHKDWYFAIKKRSSELRVEIYDAIMEKVFEGTQKELSDIASVVMDLISPQIDRDTEKWLDTREKRSLAGKKHKGNQYSKVEQTEQSGTNGTSVPTMEQMEHNETNGTVSVSVSVSDNVSVDNNSVILEENKDTNISIKKETKRFIKPTIQEIQAYVFESAESFVTMLTDANLTRFKYSTAMNRKPKEARFHDKITIQSLSSTGRYNKMYDYCEECGTLLANWER